jgi:sensor histidine kinase regulating citrate/malate metabolism
MLTDEVVGAVEEPALTGLLLGKAAEAHERGVEFAIDPGTCWPVGAAPVRDLVTIVGNLVDNALDAVTAIDGLRSVGFGAHVVPATEAEPSMVVIEVRDSGPGLPPDSLDKVFRRGFSTKEEGSEGRRGIGLALVAQAVDRLGGTLAVDGPPGAVITVRLPLGRTR